MEKVIRITTIPGSLGILLKGQLKHMSNHYEVIGVSSYCDGVLDDIGKQEGIRVIPIEMSRKITPLKDLKSTWVLYKILKKEKPLIVHSHTPKAGTVGMFASYLAGVPHRLHTIAGLPLLETKGLKRLLLNFVEKLTYRCATKIYPNSFGLKDIILKNNYTKPNKIKVLGNGSSNGIDTEYFNPNKFTDKDKSDLRLELGLKKTDYVFVFVGRLVKDKGINELISVFDRLSREQNSIKLLLVGSYEKDLDPVLESTENTINTNSNIISVGWQTDVRPYFSISNSLVFPSYREGFPNVVMQAGSMGLPSIVSNINGCNEIIKHELNGFIIPPKNEDELYKSMKEIINQKSILNNSDQIRSIISSNYGREIIWKCILEEYKILN